MWFSFILIKCKTQLMCWDFFFGPKWSPIMNIPESWIRYTRRAERHFLLNSKRTRLYQAQFWIGALRFSTSGNRDVQDYFPSYLFWWKTPWSIFQPQSICEVFSPEVLWSMQCGLCAPRERERSNESMAQDHLVNLDLIYCCWKFWTESKLCLYK